MTEPDRLAAYWNSTGAAHDFTHPLAHDWVADWPRDAAILDYGCGYGRILSELDGLGFTELTGVDPSPAVVERGRGLHPSLSLSVLERPPLTPFPDASFDAALLFAVLAVIPDDAGHEAVVAELRRVLKPGGLLYLSDVPLQDDARNRARYRAATDAPHGVFSTDDGGVFRHHDPDRLRRLLSPFTLVREHWDLDMPTLNGHVVRGVQLLLRR